MTKRFPGNAAIGLSAATAGPAGLAPDSRDSVHSCVD